MPALFAMLKSQPTLAIRAWPKSSGDQAAPPVFRPMIPQAIRMRAIFDSRSWSGKVLVGA